MMGGVSQRPLYLLRNALVPLSASAHASYGAARWRFFASHALHPHSLHYGIVLKLLLLAAADQNCRRIDAIDALHTLAQTAL